MPDDAEPRVHRDPTIYDVARLVGVSGKTVSNVVNGHPHVSASLRKRVNDAIAELGYRQNSTARNLRRGRTGIISLAVPELDLAYYANLTRNVIHAAEEHHWAVLIEQTYGDRNRERDILLGPLRQQTDGVILAGPLIDADADEFEQLNYPIVALADPGSRNLIDTLSMDNFGASRAATEHLLERGHTRIALIGANLGDSQRYRNDRARGHLEALASRRMSQDPGLVRSLEVWDRDSGYEATRDLVDAGVPFSAVRYLNDGLALGGLRALRDTGHTVPRDVAVIGFDDLEEAQQSTPTLSSVSAGRRDLARLAVSSLAEQMASRGQDRSPVTTVMDYVVRARESTSS